MPLLAMVWYSGNLLLGQTLNSFTVARQNGSKLYGASAYESVGINVLKGRNYFLILFSVYRPLLINGLTLPATRLNSHPLLGSSPFWKLSLKTAKPPTRPRVTSGRLLIFWTTTLKPGLSLLASEFLLLTLLSPCPSIVCTSWYVFHIFPCVLSHF